MKKNLLLFSSLLFVNFMTAQHLEPHRWKDRVLLLFAPHPEDQKLRDQLDLLTKDSMEVTERDLVIYQIFSPDGIKPDGTALLAAETRNLLRQFRVSPGEFAVLLIGKDGGVKLREKTVVAPRKLFDLIDSMPMRKAEMGGG